MSKLAIVRGKFLNHYEMQSFVPLVNTYDITAFGSLFPYHDDFPFRVVKLPSPLDMPEFPLKMPILNRVCVDAHYLFGLEEKLKGFDMVHTAETYYHYTQQCLNAKKKGYVKKVVATVLENIPFNNEGIHGRKKFKKRSRNELDHIIALTQKTKNALIQEGADPRKITVIGHGIDTGRFTPKEDHFSKLGMRKPDLTIIYSGRLERYKGVFDILDAFRLVKQKKKTMNLRLIFVGNGTQSKRLRAIEEKYMLTQSVCHTCVPYSGMPLLYQEADIAVAPSVSTPTWQEQYCTALLEAQSMGLPIVTTKSGGIPENVGSTALFCKESDPRSLAKQIVKFIDNPKLRVRFGSIARKRALHVHDTRIIARKLDCVYRSLT